MIWLTASVCLLAIAGLLWWRNSKPGTSWYGLDPETAESIFALPLVVAAVGIVLGIIGLLQVLA